MDSVTYSNLLIKKELENWIFVKVDISKHADVARALGTPGVPDASALDPADKILGRFPDFIQPRILLKQLLKIRKEKRETS